MKFRQERKVEITYADMLALKQRLKTVMQKDVHAIDGKYEIRSLYFDNLNDKVLREKVDGVNIREKFRIRYYNGDTSLIKLEKKSKINGLCNKETCRITAEECQKIIDGDIEFMKDSEFELMRELYSKMKYQLLRPKCIVAYTRECFVYPPGNVRVTLDMNICGSNNVKEFLNPDLPFLQTYHDSILEVKWDEYLPQIIRDSVQVKSRRSAAFSKYAAIRI